MRKLPCEAGEREIGRARASRMRQRDVHGGVWVCSPVGSLQGSNRLDIVGLRGRVDGVITSFVGDNVESLGLRFFALYGEKRQFACVEGSRRSLVLVQVRQIKIQRFLREPHYICHNNHDMLKRNDGCGSKERTWWETLPTSQVKEQSAHARSWHLETQPPSTWPIIQRGFLSISSGITCQKAIGKNKVTIRCYSKEG
jgi:hypothetical protein